MEEAAVGAVCFLFLLGVLLLTDLEIQREKNAVERARRRAARRRVRRQLVVHVMVELERIALRRRRRRRMLLRILAERCSPSVWIHKRMDEWWTTVVPSFDEEQWIQNFRMSKETFEYLCRRLKPALEKTDTNYRLSVPLHKRVAVALWKLATNSEYRSLAELFGLGISTACDCLKEFCSSVEDILLPEVIQVPNAEKQRELALVFEQKWGLPQCIGAIDSSHIPILAPQEYHTDYFNSKGWYSIVLQAVVDGEGLLWDVNVGQPGSLPDERVLHLSGLWELAEKWKLFSQDRKNIGGQEMGHYILGDAAYPLTSWLMKPFLDNGHLTQQQARYNYETGRARATVERAFVRLKGRWRCLQERNDCCLDRVKSMVLTCCVLHNLCESRGEEYKEEWGASLPLPESDAPPLPPGEESEGPGVRSALMRYLNS